MSEEEILSYKQLFITMALTLIITIVGLILFLLDFNLFFNELFYYNDLAYKIFYVISYLGDTLVAIILIAILWFVYDKRFAKNLALVVLGSAISNGILKDIFKDPRPWTRRDETGFGFPSGHSQNAVASWGYLAYESRKNKILPWIFLIIIYLIAISRIIIGVHDLQDVVGGLLFGIIFLMLFIYLEPVISEKINKMSLSFKFILAIVIPILLFIILLLIFPTSEIEYGLYCGAMLGLSLGYLIENEKIHYDPREIDTKQKIINLVIGLVITLVLYLGLDFIPLKSPIWDFIQYFILAFVLVILAPWIFTKIQRK